MAGWVAGAKYVLLIPSSPSMSVPQRSRRPRPCSAKKPRNEERGSTLSRGTLLRSGAALFALGFVDAGYSGDWSRIGAISKDTEELLKLGAYAVVPLCLAFVLTAPSSDDSSSTKS
ncbi:hypothetical protein ABZP36_006368 [Zizania latifolia]